MNIENQTQLAQLLDKIGSLYPAGIPTASIVASEMSQPEIEVRMVPRVRARLVVVGDRAEISSEELALLDAIATKGLKLTEDEYATEFVATPSEAFASGHLPAAVTIVFGAVDSPKNAQGEVIVTNALGELLVDTALKKALWRSLQGLS